MRPEEGINSDQSILLWSKSPPFCPIAHLSSFSLSSHLPFMYGAVHYPYKANWILIPCPWFLCVFKKIMPKQITFIYIEYSSSSVFFISRENELDNISAVTLKVLLTGPK